jgi:hypothetical protein
MIKFKCPHCGKDVSAGDEHAGKKGRCPACKELFVIPGAAPKLVPAAERRTPPPAADDDVEEAAPPKKKRPARDEADEEYDTPRRKKAAFDEDEAFADAPRKRRRSRDEGEDEDDGIAESPRRKRPARDDEDEEDEPRARRNRGRDDDEEDDDDRPRRRKKRRGEYADCPNCGCRGRATLVSFTWWGGVLGPRLFTHVRCNRCGTCYNGKTGEYNTTRIGIYVGVSSFIAIALVILWILVQA